MERNRGFEYFLVSVKFAHWVITEHYEGDYEGIMRGLWMASRTQRGRSLRRLHLAVGGS